MVKAGLEDSNELGNMMPNNKSFIVHFFPVFSLGKVHTYKEETNPFSSFSMPERTIDESKIINLPPVIVPLAFQNDGINSTDKSIDIENTSAEIESVLDAKECSVNNASFKNNKSEDIKQR